MATKKKAAKKAPAKVVKKTAKKSKAAKAKKVPKFKAGKDLPGKL